METDASRRSSGRNGNGENRGTVRETGKVLVEEKERGKSYGGDGGGNGGRARGSGKLEGCWR